MNLLKFVQDFNPGRFVVFFSLLLFVALLSLRFDGVINTCYWVIFTPLWIWKIVVFFGAALGCLTRFKNHLQYIDPESYIHFKSMLVSLVLHLFLACFEVLACDQLHSSRHLWVFVFLPLLMLSITCIGTSIWTLKYERSFEAELLLAVNLLQFIFIPLKLDGFISWRWELVLIPVWIVFGAALVGVSYSILLAAVFSRSENMTNDQIRATTQNASGYVLVVIPSLISMVLLVKKLDGDLLLPFSIANIPLLIAFASLVLRSFTARQGNLWWCGMQKDFYLFILDLMPSLREYWNVSYRQPDERSVESTEIPETTTLSTYVRHSPEHTRLKAKIMLGQDFRPVVPFLVIDMPD
nr:EOG090X087A [Scapholeberis mucronata]